MPRPNPFAERSSAVAKVKQDRPTLVDCARGIKTIVQKLPDTQEIHDLRGSIGNALRDIAEEIER